MKRCAAMRLRNENDKKRYNVVLRFLSQNKTITNSVTCVYGLLLISLNGSYQGKNINDKSGKDVGRSLVILCKTW